MRRRESRGIKLLPILFGAIDPTKPGTTFWLHSIGSAAANAGNKPTAELLRASELSNTAAELSDATTDGPSSCSGKAMRAMQLNERGQGNSAVVGDTGSGDRRPVHLPAFTVVPAGQRPEQMPQLRTRV